MLSQLGHDAARRAAPVVCISLTLACSASPLGRPSEDDPISGGPSTGSGNSSGYAGTPIRDGALPDGVSGSGGIAAGATSGNGGTAGSGEPSEGGSSARGGAGTDAGSGGDQDPPPSAVTRFAYSLNHDGQSVSVYSVDAASGQLRIRGYAKTGKGPRETAYDPSGQYVFVFNSGIAPSDDASVPIAPASISVFAQDPTRGDLHEVDGSPFATSETPAVATAMTLHPGGRFIYVANGAGGSSISQFAVAPTGDLSEIGRPVATGDDPTRVVFDKNGHFAYVTNERSNDLYVYEFDADTGALEELASLRTSIGGRSSPLAFDPSGEFAYVVNLEPVSLSAFTVNSSTGALTAVEGSPYALPVNTRPHPLLFHPSGKFAYVRAYGLEGSPAFVAAFSIDDETGALAALAGSPYPAGTSPFELTSTPSGSFLYVTHQGSKDSTAAPPPGSISAFGVEATTGVLKPLEDTAMPQPGAFATTVDPAGAYLYSVSLGSDRLHAYRIHPQSGILTPLSQGAVTRAGHRPGAIDLRASPTVTTPSVFAPRFAYLSDVTSSSVASFVIDVDTGLLTPSGSARSGGTSVRALAPAQSGQSLYSVQLSGNATAYSVDSASGALTPIDDGTVSASRSPVAIATEPSNRFAYALNAYAHSVTPYRIDRATARLTPNGDAVATVALPLSMVVDPTGRSVYVMSFSQVQTFSIDVESGALGPSQGDDGVKDLVSDTATQVAVEPGGKFLYAISPARIEIYPIDPQTGGLGSARVQSIGRQAVSLAIDPTGRFLYTANWTSSSVSFFTIDQQDGSLTEQGLQDVAVDPIQVVADSSGKFVYAALFDGTIATLAIDPATGRSVSVSSNGPFSEAAANVVTIGDVR